MRQKSGPVKEPAEKVVKDLRRATRRKFSAEEKIRIVLERRRGEESTAELCRREGIVQNLYGRWSKDLLEAGKKRPWPPLNRGCGGSGFVTIQYPLRSALWASGTRRR